VLFDPGEEVVEAVVALAGEEDEPGTDDLAEGEVSLPEVVRREVAVEKLGHLQALQGGEQNGDIVDPFDAEHTSRCSVHGLRCKLLSPFREVPLSLSEREARWLRLRRRRGMLKHPQFEPRSGWLTREGS
jgi:hypothetical protein